VQAGDAAAEPAEAAEPTADPAADLQSQEPSAAAAQPEVATPPIEESGDGVPSRPFDLAPSGVEPQLEKTAAPHGQVHSGASGDDRADAPEARDPATGTPEV
jgi:hypothetical protein